MKRTFIPPPRRPDEPQPPPVELWKEPEEELLLLGEMLHDISIMGEKLKALPFSKDHYRADLRVVMGAAVRMRERCARLLGELPTAADLEGAVDRLADAIVDVVEGDDLADRSGSWPLKEASNIIDEPAEAVAGQTPHVRKNGRPKKTETKSLAREGAKPVEGGIKGAIVAELTRRGPLSSTELAESIRSKSGASSGSVYDALAKMRTAKEVITERGGVGMLNRLPEQVAG